MIVFNGVIYFIIMQLIVPCSYSISGGSFIPFDTSQILFRANTGLANFGIYDQQATLPHPMFEVQNTSNKSVLLVYISGNLTSPDARLTVINSNRNLKTSSIDFFSGLGLLFNTGSNWIDAGLGSIFVSAQNGTYSGILNVTHIAGYTIDMTAKGIDSPYTYDNFAIGPQFEGFKLTLDLQIPFTGEVNYSS